MQTSMRIEKPWGYELVWEVVPHWVGKVVHINRGHRLWLDARCGPSEPVVLCSGLLVLVFEDERGELREVDLRPGQIHEIPAQRPHRMIAVEDSDIVVFASGEVDDSLRIEEA